MSEITVVQVITGGDRGFPYDSIVQIGYITVDTGTRELGGGELVTIRSDRDDWPQKVREYVGDRITDEELADGLEKDDAVAKVKKDLKGRDATSFEISNTFGRYLSFEPWDLTLETSILPSISFRMPSTVRGMDTSRENLFIDRAYTRYLPDDPLGLGGSRRNALDYARESAMLLLFLREKGLY